MAKRQTQKERLTGRLTESGKETETDRGTDRVAKRLRDGQSKKRDRKNCLAHLPDEDTFIGLFCLLFFITVICRKKR